MKYSIFCILFIAFISNPILSQSIDSLAKCFVSDLKLTNQKGRIKSITLEKETFYFAIYMNKFFKDSTSVEVFQEFYSSEGSLVERRNIKNTSRISKCDNCNIQYFKFLKHEYDNFEVLERVETRNVDETVSDTIRNIYDKTNCNLLEYQRRSSCCIDQITFYDYDTTGRKIKSRTITEFGDTMIIEFYKYINGREIIEMYNNHGELEHKTIKDYNNTGKLIQLKVVNSNGDFLINEKYKYDNLGNIIKVKSGINKGDIYKMSYTYDQQGNWIHVVTKINGIKIFDEKRKIEYH